MELAMVGLGKMGANMTTRLLHGGHTVVVNDQNPDAIARAQQGGAIGAADKHVLVSQLKATPRVVWIMVPAGVPTESTIGELSEVLAPGDIVIDGGNSYYKDSIRHAATLKEKGIHFVDVGTSGGIWGLDEGYSMMIGGDKDVVASLSPIFETLAPAPDKGWGYVGPHGSGHYVKMIHNGIEYGMMQAYGEGLAILEAKKEFSLDLADITRIWQHGSVVRSWLLDLAARALEQNRTLDGIAPFVQDSGEGRWTVAEALDLNVSAPIIMLSLERRIRSRETSPFADKLVAELRNQFGGHGVQHQENK
jgi:6-phosphogluconate dehydrogenase